MTDASAVETSIRRFAPIVAAVAVALPVLLFEYPPMTDLPYHEAVVDVLVTMRDPAKMPPGLFELQLGLPNQLFYFPAWLASYLLGVTLACKVTTAAAVASIPLGLSRVTKYLGAPSWLTLLTVTLALGWLFNFGFVTNLIGLGLLLAFLPAADRFMEAPSWRGFATNLVAGALLHLAHQLMYLAYAIACAVFAVLARKPRERLGMRAALPAVLGAGAVFETAMRQRAFESGYSREGAEEAMRTLYGSFGERITELPRLLVGKQETVPLLALTVLWIGAIVLAGSIKPLRSEALRSPRARFLAVGVVFALAVFVVPEQWHGARHIYPRFFAPAVLIVAAALVREGPMRGRARLAAVAAVILSAGTLLTVLPDFIESSEIHRQAKRSLDRLAENLPAKSSIAYLDLDRSEPGLDMTPVLAIHGGRVVPLFHETGSVLPVRISPRADWNDMVVRIGNDPWAFVPSHDFQHFAFAVVHAAHPDALLPLVTRAFESAAVLVARDGEWALYRSVLTVIAPDVHELTMPAPRPASLRDMLVATPRRMQ